jgi:hypothetical protein
LIAVTSYTLCKQKKCPSLGGAFLLTISMVSAAGLEPATHALKGHCSTN